MEDGTYMKIKAKSSIIWRGVVWGAELLRKRLRWMVGNGKIVAFWKDVSLGEKPLCDSLPDQVGDEELESKIIEYWDYSSGWQWELLCNKLSFTVLTMLALLTLTSNPSSKDNFS